MPLDYVTDDKKPLFTLDSNIDFKLQFELTKFSKKKYVINEDTGEYLGVVGDTFSCASHGDFFRGVEEVIQQNRTSSELADAKVSTRTARNNAWALLDVTLPNVSTTITTKKHETIIYERLIALHGVDGSCSNQVFFGGIDDYCTNGQVSGEHDKIKKKNSANFCIERFIQELKQARQNFYATSLQLQAWADKDMPVLMDVLPILKAIIGSDKKAEKMYGLYSQEVATRGRNMFSLYSAFTNYSSYADERNGFSLRNTGNDTNAESMWTREQEVTKWISSPTFKQLEVV